MTDEEAREIGRIAVKLADMPNAPVHQPPAKPEGKR